MKERRHQIEKRNIKQNLPIQEKNCLISKQRKQMKITISVKFIDKR